MCFLGLGPGQVPGRNIREGAGHLESFRGLAGVLLDLGFGCAPGLGSAEGFGHLESSLGLAGPAPDLELRPPDLRASGGLERWGEEALLRRSNPGRGVGLRVESGHALTVADP